MRDVKVYISKVFRYATVLLRALLPKLVVSQSNLSPAGTFHSKTVLQSMQRVYAWSSFQRHAFLVAC
jgi:hypothetical protein